MYPARSETRSCPRLAKTYLQSQAMNSGVRFPCAAPNGQAVQANSTRRANNKTVVHLRNASSPVEGEPPRCINVTAIKVEKDGESSGGLGENGHHGLSVDSSAKEEPAAGTAKPVKKVEFCKTEIHFAADSGKVNIVETDGKPPPTNKFRRRRRNNGSLVAASNVNSQVKWIYDSFLKEAIENFSLLF